MQGLPGGLFPSHFTTKIPECICFVLTVFSMYSSHSSVSSVTSLCRLDSRQGQNIFLFSKTLRPALLPIQPRGISLEIRLPGRESKHASAHSRRLRKSAAAVECGLAVWLHGTHKYTHTHTHTHTHAVATVAVPLRSSLFPLAPHSYPQNQFNSATQPNAPHLYPHFTQTISIRIHQALFSIHQ
jgi:hypothetical protein